MISFKTMLETMKGNNDTIQVWVKPGEIIYTGIIYEVGSDCLVMTFKKGGYNAVIPLDKIVMVNIPMVPTK